MKDLLNDSEKSDICAINILSHYWISNNGKLMVKVYVLHGLDGDTVEDEDVNIF